MIRIGRPALCVLMSDFLQPTDGIDKALKMLKYAGHDAIVLQLLDQDECRFPFEGTTRFVGLEGSAEAVVDAGRIAEAFDSAMQEHCATVASIARSLDFDVFLLNTNQALDSALPSLLSRRQMRS